MIVELLLLLVAVAFNSRPGGIQLQVACAINKIAIITVFHWGPLGPTAAAPPRKSGSRFGGTRPPQSSIDRWIVDRTDPIEISIIVESSDNCRSEEPIYPVGLILVLLVVVEVVLGDTTQSTSSYRNEISCRSFERT